MKKITVDGNTAAAYVSYAFSELAIIYPITPSSPMSELADEWQAQGRKNIFGQVPEVVEMQSESGAAGALHGALTCGALATTYTCSQGLLLMLPNLYKIAGELLPAVFHVSARAFSTHAFSIFGDQQDVMACRASGFAMLCSSSVQEAMDLAAVAHVATLKASVPFLHFFDGFRTSHEMNKIEALEYEELLSLLDVKDVEKFRERALSPESPRQRGTAQNPDVYFQNRERANEYYSALPSIVQKTMDSLAKTTKRAYHIFDYCGNNDAEYVLVMMGSGASCAEETIRFLNQNNHRLGLIKIRLYRPFDGEYFCNLIPKSCKRIAVLDRTKEPGSIGEPLYLDVCAALMENERLNINVLSGRYGIGQKEFTPAMVTSVIENLTSETPKKHFTVGIEDDVSFLSLPIANFHLPDERTLNCKFYGLGSDGTVGANKNSIQLIGEHTDLFVQGYFQYDSRKSGGYTISHLRISSNPIQASYAVIRPQFVACHTPSYLKRYDVLEGITPKGTFLLNCEWKCIEELNAHLPYTLKKTIAEKQLDFYVINATHIARSVGLEGKHSTVMQAAFFFLNQHLLPYEKSLRLLKELLQKKFSKKGDSVVQNNFLALDKTQNAIKKISYPKEWATAQAAKKETCNANRYFEEYISPILTLHGDNLPVSAFSADGSVPTSTARLEKHGVAGRIPKWIAENCIQCNQCSFVCPHACIRPFVIDAGTGVPDCFTTIPATQLPEKRFRIQVSIHDCMGCELCARTCPAKQKALVMIPTDEASASEGEYWKFAQNLPPLEEELYNPKTVKGSQFRTPLFEFSYACSGCGETAYIKLLTQLFGERLLIANATGCSSIYGGSSPTCPYATAKNGRGPAWASSLFEDNAEFGLGMHLAYKQRSEKAQKSIWCIGGDGWAYDIGYGGLDHVIASNHNVNILVLDSEVYSNTGGQASKATPIGAVARFAAKGKHTHKKPLALMCMQYKTAYVAQVCLGANMQQLINAFTEAESYDGPSLIIAYTPCIAHGVNMSKSIEQERLAVASGYWHLFRYDPRLLETGKNPFRLDSKEPTVAIESFLNGENRFASLKKSNPTAATLLFEKAKQEGDRLYKTYKQLSEKCD